MSHPLPRRRTQPRNKTHNWFVFRVVRLDSLRSIFLSLSSDFSNHNDSLSLWILHEPRQHIYKVCPWEGVSANSYHSALPEPDFSSLMYRLVSQSSAPTYNPDFPSFVYVAGHDSNFALIRLDNSGAVGTNQSGLLLLVQDVLHSDHVLLGYSIGYANHQWNFIFH